MREYRPVNDLTFAATRLALQRKWQPPPAPGWWGRPLFWLVVSVVMLFVFLALLSWRSCL